MAVKNHHAMGWVFHPLDDIPRTCGGPGIRRPFLENMGPGTWHDVATVTESTCHKLREDFQLKIDELEILNEFDCWMVGLLSVFIA